MDDTTVAIFSRIGARVPAGELLFQNRVDIQLTSVEEKLLHLCPKQQKEKASDTMLPRLGHSIERIAMCRDERISVLLCDCLAGSSACRGRLRADSSRDARGRSAHEMGVTRPLVSTTAQPASMRLEERVTPGVATGRDLRFVPSPGGSASVVFEANRGWSQADINRMQHEGIEDMLLAFDFSLWLARPQQARPTATVMPNELSGAPNFSNSAAIAMVECHSQAEGLRLARPTCAGRGGGVDVA